MPEGPFPAQQAAGKGAGGEVKVKLFSLRLLGLGFRLLLPGFLLQPVVKESGQEEEKQQANREVLFLDPEERAGREILKAKGHEAFDDCPKIERQKKSRAPNVRSRCFIVQ